MDWLSEYIKAWARHNVHFGTIKHLNIIDPPRSAEAVIIDDECLVYRFSHSHRIKEKKGQLNERFLNPASLLAVLDGLPEGMIIVLPVPHIYYTEGVSFGRFLEKFDSFLSALPPCYRYAIQLHNPNYLLPNYFECLRQHNVAHVIYGPEAHPVFTAGFGVIRNAEELQIVNAVRCAIDEKKKLYVYVDSSTELSHLMELLNHDLKKLSPFKRSVAA